MVREIHAAILPMQGLGRTLSHWAEIAKHMIRTLYCPSPFRTYFLFSVTKVKNPVVPIAQVYFVDAPVRVLFWIISCGAPEFCDSRISSKLPRSRLR